MDRDISSQFSNWLASPLHKPLVLRGARQVGKTWLVRDLATRGGRRLVEVNLERDPQMARCFAVSDPNHVLGELSLAMDADITEGECLLFLDEIQAAPQLLARLRWFAEELPALPVVAAGSLLDFVFADHAFSVPVGRIQYAYVEPMSFREYLRAHGQRRLLEAVDAWRPGNELSPTAHAKALEWFDRYAMIGGMPEVVAADVVGKEARHCRFLQNQLLMTFRDDFAKYSGKMDRNVLSAVLSAVAASLGHKFVFARVEDGVKQHQAKRAFELLAQARLCHVIRHSAANGLPLAGEVKDKLRKAVLLDVGLLHALLGTPAGRAFPNWHSLSALVRGQLTEQLVGQELRQLHGARGDESSIYYWQREGGRPGEIDYLLQLEGRIIPIEVKAGASGSMKSLHQFMFDKHLNLAVRFDRNPPSMMPLSVLTTQADRVEYQLVNLPPYLAGNLEQILRGL